jgi:hypothetical protein
VEYPTSNAPQAWAAGAVLLAVTAVLGLRISVPDRTLSLAPCLPEGIEGITVSKIEVAGAAVEVEARRLPGGGVEGHVRGAPEGYRVEIHSD